MGCLLGVALVGLAVGTIETSVSSTVAQGAVGVDERVGVRMRQADTSATPPQSLTVTEQVLHAHREMGEQAEAELALQKEKDENRAESNREASQAFELLILILLLTFSLCAGRALHRAHIYWLPESGATVLIGFVVGLLVHLVSPAESNAERKFYFDPQFFSLFLLPPIIFESGFALNQRLFFANFGSILTFAVVGTLISTAFMWALVYKLGQLGWIFELSMVEAGAFASLISAVDPVATLATFSNLKTDPRLHNLVFGESVLNDAVANVLFRSILSFYFDDFYAELHLPLGVLSFILTAVMSSFIGIGVAIIAALCFKRLRMAHEEGAAAVTECALFWAVSFVSYLIAMVLELSGIVSTLFCGIFMARYVTPNLSRPALALTADALRVLALVADTMVFMLVGMAVVIYTSENVTLIPFFIVAFLGCIATRALNIFPLAFLLNRVRKQDKRISCQFQMVMWFSGLRGAIAVALSVQMPGPHKGPIVVVTMLVVVASIFLLGGGSKAMLDRMEIKTGEVAPLDRELSELSVSHRRLRERRGSKAPEQDDGGDPEAVFSACKKCGISMRQLEQDYILARVVDRTIPGHEDAWERKNRLWERDSSSSLDQPRTPGGRFLAPSVSSVEPNSATVSEDEESSAGDNEDARSILSSCARH